MSDLRERAARVRDAFPPRRREPPKETGKRLATIQRGDAQELRVVWDTYEGKPYVSVRVWENRNGAWWPTKTGCTVRLRELAAFADGVAAALDEAEAYRTERAGGGHQPPYAPPPDPEGLF